MSFHLAASRRITKTLHKLGLTMLMIVGIFGTSPAASRNSDFGPSPDIFNELRKDRVRETLPVDAGLEHPRRRTPTRIHKPVDFGEELSPVAAPRKNSPPSTTPLRVPSTPAIDQTITRRYQDPRVLRLLTELTSTTGEAFYQEVSQMIDGRHIAPTTYAERVDRGVLHLKTALANPTFQQATGIHPSPLQIRSLATQLDRLQGETSVSQQAGALSLIRQAGRLAQQEIGLNPGAVYIEFVYAALDSLDKYSQLMPPEKSGQVNVGLDENLVGIGVEVAADSMGLKILKAIPGGPAADATLRKGDLITAVNGKSLRGVALGSAVDLITGPAGTPVKLSLQRDRLVADVTLIRRPVTITSIGDVRLLDESAHVGYIQLHQFAESSARELDDALWKLHEEGMESLVLDLRGNPGGYLTTAIEISDRFLPSGIIVSTRGRTAEDNSEESAKYAQTWKLPLVVLIDHESASASEIFAAAIQDNGRGLIVGETSYGKGTVQTLFPLRSATAGLRLTTAKFYSPDGREMAGVGVTPDIKVPTTSGDIDTAMLQAAVEAARDPRLQTMSQRLARPQRTGYRVIQVTTTGNE